MIIDDVDISNFIMKKMISKVSSDNEVREYTLPEKAWAEIKQIDPDIVFLDLNMPEMDGWEFLDRMKDAHLTNTVYILTSSTSELDRQKSKNYMNIKDFLIKPLDINTLATILKKYE